jgi:hypothetical protein
VDDVGDDRSTNAEAAPGMLDLLALARAIAEAEGVSPTEVAKRLLGLVSNNAPSDDAVGEAPVAPSPQARPNRSSWLTVPRAQREEQRRRHQRDMDAHRISASAEPADADVYTFIAAKESKIAAVLARLNLPPHERAFKATIIVARHCYQYGARAVEITTWVLHALRRFLLPPGSPLGGLGLFEPIAATCNALEAAIAGNFGPLRKLLPPSNKGAGQPPILTTAQRKAMLASATWALRQDGGLATNTAADAAIVRIFKAIGITLGNREPSNALREVNALDLKRRLGRQQPTDRNVSATLELFGTLQADAARHVADGQAWPLQARLAWVERQAAAAPETILS